MSDGARGPGNGDPWPDDQIADGLDDAGDDELGQRWPAGDDELEQQWPAGGDELDGPWPPGDAGGTTVSDELDERPPMTWHGLPPGPRWSWFDRLWSEVCVLRERYRLAIRSEWWADELQVEVLAAFAAWVQRYDSGEWDDPPGKLALLFDLERVAAALRDGVDPFDPERDRPAFERHLLMLGCRPPPNATRR